jgi:hypothetical protein
MLYEARAHFTYDMLIDCSNALENGKLLGEERQTLEQICLSRPS